MSLTFNVGRAQREHRQVAPYKLLRILYTSEEGTVNIFADFCTLCMLTELASEPAPVAVEVRRRSNAEEIWILEHPRPRRTTHATDVRFGAFTCNQTDLVQDVSNFLRTWKRGP